MKRKNLIYIFADQWRADAAGFAGGADPVRTPNMDCFAREAMRFSDAVSTYPLCSPHRAALLTGKHPISCGFWTYCKPGLEEVVMLKPQEVCISDILHTAGYATGYVGKWHLDAKPEISEEMLAEAMGYAVEQVRCCLPALASALPRRSAL